ncbi:Ferredoxin reductase-like, C-terminal NADP-linked [Venustampulla echinocandica]|uniref:Ferredoxin reductase-like, C-terminal NADP-linked n=1 Tax=Venustampulla echinocandica TaxID=2656787 RepID=A0A370TZX8_9HELO|nr:Ferredoxin reductase-like, C-terminal NADP-linked [Venustampulla echinocandica]RDL41091.1 Ferredoxin reductase-like, C-terminal NADP-linked [Venustampulla echinocandica]
MASPTLSSGATPSKKIAPDTSVAPFATDLNGVNQPLDLIFKKALWWGFGVLALLILAIRLAQRAHAHWRHLSTMGSSKSDQRYWAINRYQAWWRFKKHMLYAPLGKVRHNREFKLSTAANMGTIPSRFHTILLAMFILTNFSFCVSLDYGHSNRWAIIAELRGRTGVLALINMVAMIIFAGRNNPLITLLQISFDTYNLMHRWIGRIVILEAIIHTICWAVVKHAATGWSGVWEMIRTDSFIGWGTVSTTSMVLIFITSLSAVRHAFYETFLDVHIILALFAIVGVWIHCKIDNLPQLPIIQTVFILWVLERVARMLRLAWFNWARNKGWTTATVQPMPGEACRVTLHLPKHASIKPGSHAYLRFLSVNVWESHPFSVAWVDHIPVEPNLPTTEKPATSRLQQQETKTEVSFVIQAQTGMTRKLHDKAAKCGSEGLTIRAAFEGPYAGHHSLDSYGHVVLYAGATGITHQLSYVQHLIKGFNEGSIATKKITLIWIIREAEHLEWVRPWMDVILKMPRRREILTIKLFVTRPKQPKEIQSASATVQMFPGRPNVKAIIQSEVETQVGAMCVTVCGPGALADSVRSAVREVQDQGVVDFIEESFTW